MSFLGKKPMNSIIRAYPHGGRNIFRIIVGNSLFGTQDGIGKCIVNPLRLKTYMGARTNIQGGWPDNLLWGHPRRSTSYIAEVGWMNKESHVLSSVGVSKVQLQVLARRSRLN